MAKRYFSDYFDEYVYEINEDGRGLRKDINGKTVNIFPKTIPWIKVENECPRTVQPITQEEYESYGKTWKFGVYPNEKRRIKS